MTPTVNVVWEGVLRDQVGCSALMRVILTPEQEYEVQEDTDDSPWHPCPDHDLIVKALKAALKASR